MSNQRLSLSELLADDALVERFDILYGNTQVSVGDVVLIGKTAGFVTMIAFKYVDIDPSFGPEEEVDSAQYEYLLDNGYLFRMSLIPNIADAVIGVEWDEGRQRLFIKKPNSSTGITLKGLGDPDHLEAGAEWKEASPPLTGPVNGERHWKRQPMVGEAIGNAVLHKLDGAALINYYIDKKIEERDFIIDGIVYGVREFNIDGSIKTESRHNGGRPAWILAGGLEAGWPIEVDGIHHVYREDSSLEQTYYIKDGELHREDGPAIIDYAADGTTIVNQDFYLKSTSLKFTVLSDLLGSPSDNTDPNTGNVVTTGTFDNLNTTMVKQSNNSYFLTDPEFDFILVGNRVIGIEVKVYFNADGQLSNPDDFAEGLRVLSVRLAPGLPLLPGYPQLYQAQKSIYIDGVNYGVASCTSATTCSIRENQESTGRVGWIAAGGSSVIWPKAVVGAQLGYIGSSSFYADTLIYIPSDVNAISIESSDGSILASNITVTPSSKIYVNVDLGNVLNEAKTESLGLFTPTTSESVIIKIKSFV